MARVTLRENIGFEQLVERTRPRNHMDRLMNAALRILAKLKNTIETSVREREWRRKLASYLKSDWRPWRIGYYEYKVQYLSDVINNDGLLEAFRQGHPLPDGYGFRLDARVVEIPGVLARLEQRTGRLLDDGLVLKGGIGLLGEPTVTMT